MSAFPAFGPMITFAFRQALLQGAYDRLAEMDIDPKDPENLGLLALIDELRSALGSVEIADLDAAWELDME